jgi:hypothetical protein
MYFNIYTIKGNFETPNSTSPLEGSQAEQVEQSESQSFEADMVKSTNVVIMEEPDFLELLVLLSTIENVLSNKRLNEEDKKTFTRLQEINDDLSSMLQKVVNNKSLA